MKKLLATLLALSLILGSLFTGMASVSAATFVPVTPEEPESYGTQPYPIEAYDAVSNYGGYGNHLPQYEKASIAEVGVDGSYALKIEGEDKEVQSYIKLGNGANFLFPDVEYTLEFQVKFNKDLSNDENAYFEYGVHSAWNSENTDDGYLLPDVSDWETVTYTFVPSVNDSGVTGWCHVYLGYYLPAGAEVYIDNINLYVAEDHIASDGSAAKSLFAGVNYFNRGNTYGANRGGFDNYVTTSAVDDTVVSATYVAIDKADIPTTNNATDIPSATKYDSIITINAGDGVNGSAGMKIGPTNGNIAPRIGLGAEGEQYGSGATYFQKDTTYRLTFKAKKSGTVTNFSFDWNKSGSWVTNKVIAVDLTDEWVKYEAEITITAADCYSSGTRGGHNNLYLNCNVAEGSYLYIDDIEFCKTSDPVNVFYWGDFDKYTVDTVDNTVLEGVTYEPYPLYYSTPTTYDDIAAVVPKSDTAGTAVTDGYLSVSELGEGVRDSYAMVLTGTGADVENAVVIGQSTVLYGKTYEVSFKAKVSENANLSLFNMGIKRKWAWNGDTHYTNTSTTDSGNNNVLASNANVSLGLTLADSEGIDAITTEWQKFTFKVTPNTADDIAYRSIYLNYNLGAGDKLYIDDIEIYEVGGDGVNLMPNGTFGRIKSVEAIEAGDEIGYYHAKWLDDYDYYEGETLITDYHFNAYAMPSSLALSGKHVLAAGGIDDNTLPVNGRVGFEMTGIAPGKTYKVSFSLMLVGEISNLNVRLTDGGDGTNAVNLVTRKSGIATGAGSKRYLEYGSELWQDYDFYFTSEATSIVNWPSFVFTMQGEAGSGFLLDSVSVQEVLADGSLAGNQFRCEGFEIPETPDADFSSNKFWGTDVSDLSFMNDLPFAIDVMGISSTSNPDKYADIMSKDSDFAFANTVIIGNTALDVIRYEAKIANELGKEIWINADHFASEGGALSTGNWQALLTAAANIVQDIAPNNFQGFYFDEPHYHYASNDEFVEVTKFLRETFRKRVFAMNKHDAFYLHEDSSTDANVTITAESHAYVTDVGYWNYSLDGIATRVNGFNEAYTRLNPDTRAWFACLLGSEPTYNEDGSVADDSIDTEAEVIEIFNTMLAGVKDNDSFGGIMLYSAGATNGYDEIKLDENGVAEYSTYRAILESLAAEINGEVIGVDGYAVNADGILTVSTAKTVADIVADYNAVYTNLQIKDGDTVLESAASIKTGLIILVDTKLGDGTLSTAIAYENDVNGDAACDVRDLVRMKKISGGMAATAEQYAAAGSTVAEGIDADNLVDYRQFLLNN